MHLKPAPAMKLPIFPSPIAEVPIEPPQGLPLLRLGFRPFYLGATLYAALAVPAWVAVALGVIEAPTLAAPLLWHAHEMLFGFAAAVITGFLLTAGKAWTGLPTLRGPALGAMALQWLAARVAALAGPSALYAALDLALLPLAAAALLGVLLRAGNRRNLPLIALLLMLASANAAFHAAALGWLALDPLRALHAALALVVIIECVMAGRVVPAFTMGATPGLRLSVPRQLSAVATVLTVVGLAAWVVAAPAAVTAALLVMASLAHVTLLVQWQPVRTRGRPILWILHAAYAWIPAGLGLLALSVLGVVAPSAGIHALAVGATGGLVIGMVTRTARGHTGRPLKPTRREVAAYALVMAAAVLRVFLPLLVAPGLAWAAAALAWSAAFVLYLSVFGPWLLQPRVDGKDG
jgi:uncharacterized protein involved in response to NO